MLLAVQIYAPLDDSPNHRTLYVFCCLSVQCYCRSEGWICLRDEVRDTSLPTQQASTSMSINQTNWIEDADDWGDEEEDVTKAVTQPADINIEALSIHPASPEAPFVPSAEVEGMEESVNLEDAPTKPTVDIRALLAPTSSAPLPEDESLSVIHFSSFFLNVTEEPALSNQQTKLDLRVKELLAEYQTREKVDLKKIKESSGASSADKEAYEKSRPSHGDELVHKFVLRVQQTCPEQLIRYHRESSSPLLLQPLKNKLPQCQHCGSSLIYEMQLMPHLSRRLTLPNFPDNPNPVDLGTVIIFTCSKSCWNNQEGSDSLPRLEYLVVQSDMF